MSQAEWWQSPLFPRAARLAIEIAKEEAPGGFRLVSNFGDDAMQSQLHGHLHVLGGVHLGLYMDFPRKGDFWLRKLRLHGARSSGGRLRRRRWLFDR